MRSVFERSVSHAGVICYLKQLLENGLFHADPVRHLAQRAWQCSRAQQ